MRAVVGLALVFGGLGVGVLVLTGHLPASSQSGSSGPLEEPGNTLPVSEPGNPLPRKGK